MQVERKRPRQAMVICRNTGFPSIWQSRFIRNTDWEFTAFWKKIHTDWQMILKESDLKRQMR